MSIKKYSITDQDVDYQSLASGNRTKDGELCAVNLLGKTVSSVEKEYGVKLSLTEYGYCAVDFPYTLSAPDGDREAPIKNVSINKNGKLNSDLSYGIKYNDLISYCSDKDYSEYDDDYYYFGVTVYVPMGNSCYAGFIWSGETTDTIAQSNPPCTRIEYYFVEN